MERLIEQQAVIDCLTNTAKYYEREDADEWTKGIHYGLLHGLDNILDNVSTVEAIPKDQYEARLKADMIAMLEELYMEVEELDTPSDSDSYDVGIVDCEGLIQQKIDKLRGENNGQES